MIALNETHSHAYTHTHTLTHAGTHSHTLSLFDKCSAWQIAEQELVIRYVAIFYFVVLKGKSVC